MLKKGLAQEHREGTYFTAEWVGMMVTIGKVSQGQSLQERVDIRQDPELGIEQPSSQH